MKDYRQEFENLRNKKTSNKKYVYSLYDITNGGDYHLIEDNISREQFEKEKENLSNLQHSGQVSLRHFESDGIQFAYKEEIRKDYSENDYYLKQIKLFAQFKEDFIKENKIKQVDIFNAIVESICDGFDLEMDLYNVIDHFEENPKLLKLLR